MLLSHLLGHSDRVVGVRRASFQKVFQIPAGLFFLLPGRRHGGRLVLFLVFVVALAVAAAAVGTAVLFSFLAGRTVLVHRHVTAALFDSATKSAIKYRIIMMDACNLHIRSSLVAGSVTHLMMKFEESDDMTLVDVELRRILSVGGDNCWCESCVWKHKKIIYIVYTKRNERRWERGGGRVMFVDLPASPTVAAALSWTLWRTVWPCI